MSTVNSCDQTMMPPGALHIPRDTTTGRVPRNLAAGLVVAIVLILARVAVGLDIGWIMIVPLFGVTVFVTRWSPPIAALSLLYGWVLIGLMDFPGFWIMPRIPTTSILTVWLIFWLAYWRSRTRSIRQLVRWSIVRYLFLVSAFVSIGILRAFQFGYLSHPAVQFYNWDIARVLSSYLLVGVLGCQSSSDLKVILVGLPFAYLLYPLTLPLETWQHFFSYSLHSSSLLSVGLSYGSLNTDTLGQAAATATAVSTAVGLHSKSGKLRLWMFGTFLLSACTMLMTGSRQAIVSLLVGLIVIGLTSGLRRALLWLTLLGIVGSIGSLAVVGYLPADSGMRARFLELAQPPDTWSTHSATVRLVDFGEALKRWQEAPVLGVGFGGQRFDEIAPEAKASDVAWELRGTHNLFLAILAQTGITGLLLFLVFSLGILRRFLRLTRLPDAFPSYEGRLARVAVLSTLACVFVQQNISGGLGMSSATLVFLLGTMLGIPGWTRASAATRSLDTLATNQCLPARRSDEA